VARIISGKLDLEHKNVNVGDLLEGATGTLEPAAASKRIDIEFDINPAVKKASVSGDKDRLNQVFWNLFANAVKFTPNGGHIRIDADVKGDLVEVAVSDTGRGITPEFLPYVFDRFRQDRSTIKRGGGLGLGLAVVRNLTEMHGGSVKAFSEGEGKGSTFTVTLPLAKNGDSNGKSEKGEE
jgi:signal transduction histidine kinase